MYKPKEDNIEKLKTYLDKQNEKSDKRKRRRTKSK
tara:strand:- start:1665 stop:1769 length:105 start_codon:yes stop_codon:yes gene_type:complete